MKKIYKNILAIKDYMRTIEDAQKQIADLMLQIELEVYEEVAKKGIDEKRSPEVERFYAYIDTLFRKEN